MNRRALYPTLLFALAALLCLLAVRTGPVSLRRLDPEAAAAILWGVRIPRVLLAFWVGGSLALSGLLCQMSLQNPLADPYLLAISSGAMVGAVLSVGFLHLPLGGTILLSFFGGIAGLLLSFLACGPKRWLDPPTLVLGGALTTAFLSALAMLGLTVASDPELPGIFFWFAGDCSLAEMAGVRRLALASLPLLAVALFFGRELRLLEGGEEEARALGVRTRRVSAAALGAAALATSACVAHVGMIGFVGLLVPHAARRLLGGRGGRPPALSTFWIGGGLLVASDLAARSLLASGELPVGVLTAIVGCPFLIWLLRRRQAP